MTTSIYFKEGERIRVAATYHWAREAIGIISYPPETAQGLVEDHAPWVGLTRTFKGAQRLITFYWVLFDEPQFDSDGDGPYKGGEIDAEAIEKLET